MVAYGAFIAFVIAALVLDLKVLHKDAHEVTTKEAAITSAVWVSLALLFGVGVWIVSGGERATYFITGYLIEESLSVDNIFVFILIFSFFAVPKAAQHRVLFYGVLGAQIFRGIFIAAGVALIQRFEFVIYIFGAFLVYSGIKFLRHDGEPVDPSDNTVLKLVRRMIPISDGYDGAKLFTREGTVNGKPMTGRRIATPLFAVLVLIEVSDLVFAVDSIPAVIGIFPNADAVDPFIVFTSNIFAILGLRALYFLLSGVVGKFHYLRIGLALVLAFVGVKMLASHYIHLQTWVSLVVIATCIGGSVWASIRWPAPEPVLPEGTLPDETASSNPLN